MMRSRTTQSSASFLTDWKLLNLFDPREAFFGGRTNAVKLHHEVASGEKIKYIDVTSLYPWVNKTQEYSIGHPEIIGTHVTNMDFL